MFLYVANRDAVEINLGSDRGDFFPLSTAAISQFAGGSDVEIHLYLLSPPFITYIHQTCLDTAFTP